MARGSSTCVHCSAKVPRESTYCPSCGRPVGVDLDLAALEEDDELARRPVTVVPESPHGLRNLLIGVGVAAALLGGVVLVSRDESGRAAGESTTTTAVDGTTSTTARTRPSTTTTAAFRQLPALGPLLPEPTGLVLYGHTDDGRVARIELDTGALTTRHILGLGAEMGGVALIPRAGAIVTDTVWGAGASFVVPLDLRLEPQEMESGSDAMLLPGPGPDELWRVQLPQAPGVMHRIDRVTVDGRSVGPELTLPALADVRDDGGGRLVVYGIGGTYLLDPDTGQLRRISVVPFAAVNQTVLVDFACDDGGRCQLRVTDRATGQARLLSTPVPADPYGFLNGPLSPDGRYLVYHDDVGRLGVLDLTSGEQRPLALPEQGPGPGLGGSTQATWSPDSSLLFWPGTDGLHVWRVGAPQALTIDRPDWPTFLALVALPA